MKKKSHIYDLIGNTPIIELTNIKKELHLDANIYAKLEYFNPSGSVKDRAAYFMIKDAEDKKLINENTVIIEPTSGNTGIGLACIAASKGYKVILTMSESMSIERQKLLKAYGAELVLTEASKGVQGAIDKAEELVKCTPNAFMPSQFTNPANVQAHIHTTGPEIWEAMDTKVDVFISGIGTGGTITGTGQFLKSKNPAIKVIGVEPEKSPFLSMGTKGPHGIQGIGAGFCPEILNKDICDSFFCVRDEDAMQKARLVSTIEGILPGISSGAALHCAIELSKKAEYKNCNIVVIFPDTGERYLSTALFE